VNEADEGAINELTAFLAVAIGESARAA